MLQPRNSKNTMDLWRRKLPSAFKNTYYLVLAPISRTLARAFIHGRRPLCARRLASLLWRKLRPSERSWAIPNRIESIARTIRQTVSAPENRLSSSVERVRINERQDGWRKRTTCYNGVHTSCFSLACCRLEGRRWVATPATLFYCSGSKSIVWSGAVIGSPVITSCGSTRYCHDTYVWRIMSSVVKRKLIRRTSQNESVRRTRRRPTFKTRLTLQQKKASRRNGRPDCF